jgi:hypothetical protein
MPGGEITIQARFHVNPLGRWITFTITSAGRFDLAMVLDSGAPISALNPVVAAELTDLGLLARPRSRRYEHRLTALTVSGQPLADLDLRILPRLTELGIDGLLGLDFLAQFIWVRFHVPALRLFLEPA